MTLTTMEDSVELEALENDAVTGIEVFNPLVLEDVPMGTVAIVSPPSDDDAVKQELNPRLQALARSQGGSRWQLPCGTRAVKQGEDEAARG